jgi:excisionase family DNA binding protein
MKMKKRTTAVLLKEIWKLRKSVEMSNILTAERLNVDNACKYLGIKKSTIYKMAAEKLLPHYKYCNKLHFDRSILDEWIKSHLIERALSAEEIAQDYILKKTKKHDK